AAAYPGAARRAERGRGHGGWRGGRRPVGRAEERLAQPQPRLRVSVPSPAARVLAAGQRRHAADRAPRAPRYGAGGRAQGAGPGGPGGAGRAFPRPVVRRRTPARGTGARAGHAAGLRAGRRTHREPGPRHGAQDVRVADSGKPGIRHGVCYRDARCRTGRPGRPPTADGARVAGIELGPRVRPARLAMLIDTHCHLDAADFDADRLEVARAARAGGVGAIVIPAVERANFGVVRDLAHQIEGGAYALGIHPLYVGRAQEADLDALRDAVVAALDDPRFVAIGEIGLDFFVKDIATGEPRARQERFYDAQLALAAEFDLPVLLHVRRSQDI